ncbi:hypothetical protein [Providencia hangzhouensis]|uniref:hypothetical protein n=1 Tax=Providencia hangzhouensis TaxID=3031799 RepID=UPI0034DD013E
MSSKSCFVIMGIGDQYSGGELVASKMDLLSKYDNLIKEAILKAKPDMEVVRADEVSVPGTMSTDIITRIMHSDFIIADITIPNPNVFYELGLRHACKTGTIIIKEKGASTPFDISHLRHIEYENSTQGLKALSSELKKYFSHFEQKPDMPDNHFLELAKLTNYKYPRYEKETETQSDMLMKLVLDPDMLEIFAKKQNGEEIDAVEVLQLLSRKPELAKVFFASGTAPQLETKE